MNCKIGYKLEATAVGPRSANVICPSCNAPVQTRIVREASAKTHLLSLLLCPAVW